MWSWFKESEECRAGFKREKNVELALRVKNVELVVRE